MPYIGVAPSSGLFKKLDSISTVNNQAAYTMQYNSSNFKPATAEQLIVSVNGVIQAPNDAYTVSGSTITFSENLVTGDVIDFIVALGEVGNTVTPVDGSVDINKMSSSLMTESGGSTTLKIDNIQNSSGTSAISIDSSGRITKPQTPAFMIGINATYTHTTNTAVQYDTTDGSGGYNQGSHFDTANYKFVAPVTGIYHFSGQIVFASGEETRASNFFIKINGTATDARYYARTNLDGTTTGGSSYLGITGNWTLKLTANDEVQWFASWETDGGSDGFDSTESVFNHGTYISGHLVG